MSVLGPVHQRPVVVPAVPPTAHQPVATQNIAGDATGLAVAGQPLVRLEIWHDDSIDRYIFEYRRGEDEVVLQWPARHVVEFYRQTLALTEDSVVVAPAGVAEVAASADDNGVAAVPGLGDPTAPPIYTPPLAMPMAPAAVDGAGGTSVQVQRAAVLAAANVNLPMDA